MLDIAPGLVEPVMTHQYRLRFADGAAAEKALAVLRRLKLGAETVLGARLSGTDIQFGCQIYDRLEGDGEIAGVPGRNEPLYFFDLLIGIGGHLAMPPLPHHRAYGSRTTAVRPG